MTTLLSQFREETVAAARDAIQAYAAPSPARAEAVHTALEHLCAEAGATGMPPENMVLIVKELWKAVEHHPFDMQRDTMYRALLATCLAKFYTAGEVAAPPA